MKLRKKIISIGTMVIMATTTINTIACNDAESKKQAWEIHFSKASDLQENFNYQIGEGGWGNNEIQEYTNLSTNSTIKDGHLVVSLVKEKTTTGLDHWTSARLNSKRTFKYGKIEFRAKFPVGVGLWPALWLMPKDSVYGGWPFSGEIDVVEAKGRVDNQVSSALHYQTVRGHQYNTNKVTLENNKKISDWNTYAVDWTPQAIEFYVNNRKILSKSTFPAISANNSKMQGIEPFDQDFYIIINLAFGGKFDGGQYDRTIEKAEMLVDYIKYTPQS